MSVYACTTTAAFCVLKKTKKQNETITKHQDTFGVSSIFVLKYCEIYIDKPL